MKDEERPDPNQLLVKYRGKEHSQRGSLKVFFGYAAGVGKTYSMLREASEEYQAGRDVLLGYIEPHARPATLALLEGLPSIPPKKMTYRQLTLNEFDLDLALAKAPELILVDELAHTNVAGSRNRKRYQDIEELLNAGIDVYTTVNVQHLESLNDIVETITTIHVAETVPDVFFDSALIKLIDVEPEELLKRLEAGAIYQTENAQRALVHFFTLKNLSLLREVAIRKAADHISVDNRLESMDQKKVVQGKLLVYLENKSSRGDEKSIRWTARLAATLRVEWVALYVQEEEAGVSKKQAQLEKQFELAEQLGAQTVTLNSDNKISSLIHYAKITGVSDIIVSKNRKKHFLRYFFHKEVEDILVDELPNVDIHIISYLERDRQSSLLFLHQEWLNRESFSTQQVIKSVLLLVSGTLFSTLFTAMGMGDQNVIIVYLFVVLLISRVTEGYLYGILSSLASVLLFNWFFVDPLYSLTVYKPGYPITLVIMLSVALVTSNMMIRVKKQAFDSIEKEHRMSIIYELNKHLLTTKSMADIITLTNRYLSQTLEKSVIFYPEKPESNGHDYELENYTSSEQVIDILTADEEQAVANWVFNNGKEAGYGSNTLMGASAYYLPILSQGSVLGVIGILCKKERPLNHENHNFLKLVSSQLSLAMARQQLADEQRQIVVENAREKMRGNLLRAISHDLRTPLTGILGASSAILENQGKIAPALESQLLTDIKEDSEWLIRMVENLLSVTRIDEGTMRVKKVPEAVEEVVGAAVNRIRKRFKQQAISVSVPDQLLLVPMDGKLIEQVLINLLENAIKHSGSAETITVAVTQVGEAALFKVIDQGKGIDSQALEQLFTNQSVARTQVVPIDSQRGLGIGLSICQTIVAAHNGTMTGKNGETGGAVLSFSLPLYEEEVE